MLVVVGRASRGARGHPDSLTGRIAALIVRRHQAARESFIRARRIALLFSANRQTSWQRNVTGSASLQRKRMFNVARPKIFRPLDLAATRMTPERVSGSKDLIRPVNSMSAPSAADTIAGWDSRTA